MMAKSSRRIIAPIPEIRAMIGRMLIVLPAAAGPAAADAGAAGDREMN
jgi:hypothetical protein